MKVNKLLLLFISFCYIEFVQAQNSNAGLENDSKNPAWIRMMDDTLTNYYEAQKLFNDFWKSKPLPIEEEEIIGHTELKKEERKGWLEHIFKTRKERMEEESERYAFQYKRFKHWENMVHPYVQDDGSILTPSQRIAIWKSQQSK